MTSNVWGLRFRTCVNLPLVVKTHYSCWPLLYLQKLASRQVALEKSTSTSENDKEKWKECLIEELISSEDSDEDGSFLVRPLPWRAEKVTNLFCSLDKKQDKKRSKKSKIMTFERKTGLPSYRTKPMERSIPAWTVRP